MPTREQLENLLRDPGFRREFVADYVQEMVSAQIRTIRECRGWTQEQLGEAAAGMSQVQVSRLENPDYSGASLNSLKRMAQAFDVGLIVRMVPFSEFMDWITNMNPERLVPPNYTEEQGRHRIELERALRLDAISAELYGDNYQVIVGDIPTSAGGFILPVPNTFAANIAQRLKERPSFARTAQGERNFAFAA